MATLSRWKTRKRLAFLVFVRIVERIQDKPHAHGGASLTDTLLLYQVPHVDKVDEHGREHSLILRVIVTNNAGELAVVDSDGFEQGRRQRVVRILPQGQDSPLNGPVYLHERVRGKLLQAGSPPVPTVVRAVVRGVCLLS